MTAARRIRQNLETIRHECATNLAVNVFPQSYHPRTFVILILFYVMHDNETIKDAVDPNGVLSAGRYGIWPKHLRKA